MKFARLGLLAFLSLVFASLFLAAGPAPAVLAQQPTPADDEVNAIAQELFCPVCENVPLDVCPTEACRQWRELIRQMLAEGKSEEEIQQYFVENYGARVLSEPPPEGINWLVYIVPPLAFLGGVYLLFRAFRTWKRLAREPEAEAGSGSGPAAPPDDEYAARFEAELKKRK